MNHPNNEQVKVCYSNVSAIQMLAIQITIVVAILMVKNSQIFEWSIIQMPNKVYLTGCSLLSKSVNQAFT